MTTGAGEGEVFVEAPARLHFGVLDLRGGLGRWFGGIGASAPAPTLLVSARPAKTLEVSGEDADRAADFAQRFLSHYDLTSGAHLVVHRGLPAHAGLGSGTQLGLSVARALSELNGVQATAPDLALAVGRASRSAIGTWTFAGGGLVLEGGRRPGNEGVAPLLARLPFPPAWRCIVAIPDGQAGVSGAGEEEAFSQLPAPPELEVWRVAHMVLMGLLPSLAEADLPGFGEALSGIQAVTGGWFAPVQGDAFAPGPGEELVRRMAEWGATGVGQSSWGPAVYGIVEGEDAGARLADRVWSNMGGSGAVFVGPFRTDGARVWRLSLTAKPPSV